MQEMTNLKTFKNVLEGWHRVIGTDQYLYFNHLPSTSFLEANQAIIFQNEFVLEFEIGFKGQMNLYSKHLPSSSLKQSYLFQSDFELE